MGYFFTVDKELQESFALSWTSVPQRATVILQQSKLGESNASVLFFQACYYISFRLNSGFLRQGHLRWFLF